MYLVEEATISIEDLGVDMAFTVVIEVSSSACVLCLTSINTCLQCLSVEFGVSATYLHDILSFV